MNNYNLNFIEGHFNNKKLNKLFVKKKNLKLISPDMTGNYRMDKNLISQLKNVIKNKNISIQCIFITYKKYLNIPIKHNVAIERIKNGEYYLCFYKDNKTHNDTYDYMLNPLCTIL